MIFLSFYMYYSERLILLDLFFWQLASVVISACLIWIWTWNGGSIAVILNAHPGHHALLSTIHVPVFKRSDWWQKWQLVDECSMYVVCLQSVCLFTLFVCLFV